ncbi:MAG: hypothetical protein ACREPM_11910 [Gemmatimonadaceae bacterium]
MLLGAALVRTRIIPRRAGWVAAVTPVIHFGSNTGGLLWLDEATWIALAAAYSYVARLVLHAETREA